MSHFHDPAKHLDRCCYCCLKIENLSVVFGKQTILDNINLHIHCGELTAIIGPNGAGKTTLVKSIIKDVPLRGKISFIDSQGNSTKRLVIGYTPQKLHFDKETPATVRDLFLSTISNNPICFYKSNSSESLILRLLSMVNAQHLMNCRLGNLSGGELQRVLLALSLYPTPNLLLLDEPVSGIDPEGTKLFYELVSNLRHQFDLSIILISHDVDAVSQYANRIIYLDKTIKYSGDAQGLYQFLNQKVGVNV